MVHQIMLGVEGSGCTLVKKLKVFVFLSQVKYKSDKCPNECNDFKLESSSSAITPEITKQFHHDMSPFSLLDQLP